VPVSPVCQCLWQEPYLGPLCLRCPPPAFARSCFDLRGGGGGSGGLTVGDWLDSIRMGRYRDHFAAGGYSSLGMVLRMNAQ